MSFSVHTFESNPKGNLGFAFHHTLGEGKDLYFLAKFSNNISNAESCAESIFGAMVDFFDENKGKDSYDLFEEGLKKANIAAKKLGQDFEGSSELLVSFFDFHHLYLSQSGQSEAYLLRNGNISQISEIPEDGDDLFINILNGQVAIDDIVLFSSHRILRTITANQLSDIFARPNFAESVNVFRHELSSKSDEDILVTIIGVGKKDSISAAGFLSKVIAKKDEILGTNEDETEDNIVEKNDRVENKKADLSSTASTKAETMSEELYADLEDPIEDFDERPPTKKISLPSMPSIKMPKLNFNKNIFVIVGIVAGLILFGLLIGKIFSGDSEEEARLREQLSIARENLQQADSFLLQGDKDSAKENLTRAEEAAQTILKSKYFRSDAQFILADIDKKKQQVENAHNTSPKLVADLGVKNDNLESLGLLELRGNLYVHDSKFVHKTIRNVVEKGLPVAENSTIVSATSRVDQNLILFLTNDPQIIEYKEGLLTPMRTTDENWKRGIDIKTYGRYSYVLDPAENQIWKYERKRANYSGAIAYNQGADLSRSISFAIDGAIYVLADDGSLQKIFRGEKIDYDFRELPSLAMSGKNLKIYTTADLDYLYVLDPDNSRILIFVKGDKFATYKKQILFDLPDARDFSINDSGQKVNILTKDKIYEFAL